MNNQIYSREDFITYLKTLADKYALKIANEYQAASLRDDLYFPIKSCEENNIDIHDLFPIKILCDGTFEFKFYQNGDVYLHTPQNIVCLYRSYGSDCICQDK